tara:strand:+ start:72 stop:266 length:195 start_codon:yes stop_codon:yes gene_type:complete
MATTKTIRPFDEQDTRLAMGQDAGNFYRQKAKYDAKKHMKDEKYDPTEGKKRGKKLLDDLLDGV